MLAAILGFVAPYIPTLIKFWQLAWPWLKSNWLPCSLGLLLLLSRWQVWLAHNSAADALLRAQAAEAGLSAQNAAISHWENVARQARAESKRLRLEAEQSNAIDIKKVNALLEAPKPQGDCEGAWKRLVAALEGVLWAH